MAPNIITLPLTATQWEAMTPEQQGNYLKTSGAGAQLEAAKARGEDLQFRLTGNASGDGTAPTAPTEQTSRPSVGTIAGTGGGLLAAQQIQSALTPAATSTTTALTGGQAIANAPGAASALTPGTQAAWNAGADAATAGASTGPGSYILPGIGIAMGTYGGIKLAQAQGDMAAGSKRDKMGVTQGAMSGAAVGAGVGSVVPVIGTAIGAGAGALIGGTAGYLGSRFGSSKKADQMQRDQQRSALQKMGVYDDKYNVTLADGSKYDLGRDGGYRDANGLRAQELSTTPDNLQHTTVGWAGPLAALVDSSKEKDGLAGQLAKSAMSNANGDLEVSRKNLLGVFQKMGITKEDAMKQYDAMVSAGAIDKQTAAAYKYGLETLTSGKYFNNELERFKANATKPGTIAGTTTPGAVVSSASGTPAPAGTPAAAPVAAAPAKPALPARSMTTSAGIGKDGKPISYDKDKAVNKRLLRA